MTSDRVQNGRVLFADLVAVCDLVRETSARNDKIGELSPLLRDESPTGVALLATLLLRTNLFDDDDDAAATAADADADGGVEPRATPSLTCDHVADAIAEIDRAPARALRRNLLHHLLGRATVEEQRWIRTAVRTRQPEQRTFDLVVSTAANGARVPVGSLRRAATLTGSLPLAIRIAFERGSAGLDSVALEPGRPILPTIAEGEDSLDVVVDASTPVSVEWNIDADRIQVHRLRNEVSVYDDALDDVTDALPGVVAQVAAFPRGDLILDGWVDLGGEASPQPPAVTGWTRRGVAARATGRALFFDVLFDGASVVDEPLTVRHQLLAAIVPEESRVPILESNALDDVVEMMIESVRLGHDGLIMKDSEAPYEGALVKSSWRKIKAVHVVHLAVVAAERGTGGRSNLLSTVHLAARDDRGRFPEVGKTARGLSDETVVWQTAAFAELAVDGYEGDDDRVFRLRPDIIAIVAIDGIDDSDRNPIGLALRQPRVIGYDNVSAVGVTTVDELRVIADRDRDVEGGSDPNVPRLATTDAASLPRLPDVEPAGAKARIGTDTGSAPRSGDTTVTLPPALGVVVGSTERRTIAGVDFEPYQEPVMLTSRAPWRAVIGVRIAVLVWTLMILVAALIERFGSGTIDGSTVALVGRVGYIVVVAVAVTGWAWSDQLVRTLTLLDGRRPTRPRCVSAWAVPVVTVMLLALVVVPIEPTEPLDIRPSLIVGAFTLVMWRPYALIRRILATLIRLRSDALIATAYILDVLAFGILWWRLTLWGQRGDVVSEDEIDVFIGTVAAVTIAMAMALIVWFGLLRAARKAVAHRRSSQRTRYEHRMLRLRGVDPTDPEIWWALVQRRADEQRAEEEAKRAASEPQDEGPESWPPALPTVDDLIDVVRAEHSVALRRLGVVEAEALEDRLRKEFSAIVDDTVVPDGRADGADEATVIDEDGFVEQFDEIVAREAALDKSADAPERVGESAVPSGLAAPVDAALEDPIDTMRRRAPRPQTDEQRRNDLEVLMSRAGALQVDVALEAHRKSVLGQQAGERMVPPTLYLVEAARLAMVVTFGALTLVAGWLVSLSLGADAAAGTGELAPSVVDDLDLARRIFWGLLTVGVAFVPFWSLALLREARRAGVTVGQERRAIALVPIAVLACVGGFAFDSGDRGVLTLLLCIPIVWSAVAAGFRVEPARVWFDLPTTTLTAWLATLPMIVGVAWLAGLTSPVEPTASLQRLAFTTILLALGCARVTVMATLSSVDLEDEIRLSPELAVPARSTRRS
jgi:DNA ligase-1